ncbi:hypothetical protein [Microbacterium sp.]|uniref:hypothetical protein n=1 Tax=Microbacterium sp. TaxID=51671 RepID=UPI0027352424|nr:hypothetical protein [Microbacterium sp.]MDP3950738.1 hypothetical protein [Microbacterium sp.]
MAFSRWQFWRGVVAAWVVFMMLLALFLTFTAVVQSGPPWGSPYSTVVIYLMYGIPVGGITAAVIAVVAAPAAWAVARGLSSTRRIGLHLGAYLTLGAVLGLSVPVVSTLIGRGDLVHAFEVGYPWYAAAGCAVSITAGWSWTVWRSVREGSAPPLLQR